MLVATTQLKHILMELEQMGYDLIWVEGYTIWLGVSNLQQDLDTYRNDTKLITYLKNKQFTVCECTTDSGLHFFGFQLN